MEATTAAGALDRGRDAFQRHAWDFSWIDPPVTGDDGWPLERRGVVESAPGLYFVGLAFQYAFSSMLVGGAGRDAEYVVKHLDARSSKVTRSKMTSAA
jgi:putative flavoprotein involved in K+ transport